MQKRGPKWPISKTVNPITKQMAGILKLARFHRKRVFSVDFRALGYALYPKREAKTSQLIFSSFVVFCMPIYSDHPSWR